jgi:quinol-cytochrome oxidoreductase complex cytochrome b subunit
VLGWSLLVVVMAIGFLGYLTPGMRMNWETIAAMCGF